MFTSKLNSGGSLALEQWRTFHEFTWPFREKAASLPTTSDQRNCLFLWQRLISHLAKRNVGRTPQARVHGEYACGKDASSGQVL